MEKVKKIPNKTLYLKCTKCGHEQEVTSVYAERDAKGGKHYWFGSSRDFCDACDGPLKEI